MWTVTHRRGFRDRAPRVFAWDCLGFEYDALGYRATRCGIEERAETLPGHGRSVAGVCGSVSEKRGGGGLGVWGGVGEGALQVFSEEVAGLERRGEERKGV